MLSDIHPGISHPLGASLQTGGVNFAIYSRHAQCLELLLFDGAADPAPARVIRLDARRHRTADYWHVLVKGLEAGQLYAWRAHGPFAPSRGLRFDGEKVLIDPYARAVVMNAAYDRVAAIRPGDNCAQALRSVVVDARAYDWEGDRPLCRPYGETLIYELHVGGFTRHESSGLPAALRGTYAGLIEKIPYLVDLGVTAVELLPVQHFDPHDAPLGRLNYWGYSPLAFFAPHGPYSSRRDPLGPVDEFRDMVKALHRAGIEVILDVVFNHTAEGDERGPTLCFKGLDNGSYYIAGDTPATYANYTGCGNTINANHSVMRHLIIDCLRHWVAEMHVDGFRFDLASVLSRDGKGKPRANAPILWSIDSDPVLAGSKLIAEAWDAAGLYQVGSFTGERFAEWNGPFRDDLRRFLRGDEGLVPAVGLRLAGSPDLYANPTLATNRSVNFITCHDGFTLADLVSYAQKHNEANGEGNRDGSNDNFSANYGVEGPTADPRVLALRARQVRNFLALLLTAQGTPMLSMGDELGRSQRGNNNAYCQDNDLAWLDWSPLAAGATLHRYVRDLAAYARGLAIFRDERFWREDGAGGTLIQWHGIKLGAPDWSAASRSLACTLSRAGEGEWVHLCLNAWREALSFELPPPPPGAAWHRVLDTSLPPGEDLRLPPSAPALPGGAYRVADRSVVLLQALPVEPA